MSRLNVLQEISNKESGQKFSFLPRLAIRPPYRRVQYCTGTGTTVQVLLLYRYCTAEARASSRQCSSPSGEFVSFEDDSTRTPSHTRRRWTGWLPRALLLGTRNPVWRGVGVGVGGTPYSWQAFATFRPSHESQSHHRTGRNGSGPVGSGHARCTSRPGRTRPGRPDLLHEPME